MVETPSGVYAYQQLPSLFNLKSNKKTKQEVLIATQSEVIIDEFTDT